MKPVSSSSSPVPPKKGKSKDESATPGSDFILAPLLPGCLLGAMSAQSTDQLVHPLVEDAPMHTPSAHKH